MCNTTGMFSAATATATEGLQCVHHVTKMPWAATAAAATATGTASYVHMPYYHITILGEAASNSNASLKYCGSCNCITP